MRAMGFGEFYSVITETFQNLAEHDRGRPGRFSSLPVETKVAEPDSVRNSIGFDNISFILQQLRLIEAELSATDLKKLNQMFSHLMKEHSPNKIFVDNLRAYKQLIKRELKTRLLSLKETTVKLNVAVLAQKKSFLVGGREIVNSHPLRALQKWIETIVPFRELKPIDITHEVFEKNKLILIVILKNLLENYLKPASLEKIPLKILPSLFDNFEELTVMDPKLEIFEKLLKSSSSEKAGLSLQVLGLAKGILSKPYEYYGNELFWLLETASTQDLPENLLGSLYKELTGYPFTSSIELNKAVEDLKEHYCFNTMVGGMVNKFKQLFEWRQRVLSLQAKLEKQSLALKTDSLDKGDLCKHHGSVSQEYEKLEKKIKANNDTLHESAQLEKKISQVQDFLSEQTEQMRLGKRLGGQSLPLIIGCFSPKTKSGAVSNSVYDRYRELYTEAYFLSESLYKFNLIRKGYLMYQEKTEELEGLIKKTEAAFFELNNHFGQLNQEQFFGKLKEVESLLNVVLPSFYYKGERALCGKVRSNYEKTLLRRDQQREVGLKEIKRFIFQYLVRFVIPQIKKRVDFLDSCLNDLSQIEVGERIDSDAHSQKVVARIKEFIERYNHLKFYRCDNLKDIAKVVNELGRVDTACAEFVEGKQKVLNASAQANPSLGAVLIKILKKIKYFFYAILQIKLIPQAPRVKAMISQAGLFYRNRLDNEVGVNEGAPDQKLVMLRGG